MNLRAGTVIEIDRMVWDEKLDPEERTPANAELRPQTLTVDGCEWLPGSQRMVVRLVTYKGGEITLTKHELELNGARNG